MLPRELARVERMSEQNSEPRPFDPPVPPAAPPAAPTEPPAAPPAPPAPSSPDLPAVPQYGEYAPAGYVPPAPSEPTAPANPYGVPGYAAPATPSNMYGVPAATAAPAYAPLPTKKRRTWDVVLTVILLILGLFGTGLALIYAAIFSNPEVLSQAISSQGYGTFAGTVGSAPTVLIVSHVLLYLLALGLSIPLLIRGRIVVFWIPLTIGAIAAIIFWVTLASVLLSDPNFVSRAGG